MGSSPPIDTNPALSFFWEAASALDTVFPTHCVADGMSHLQPPALLEVGDDHRLLKVRAAANRRHVNTQESELSSDRLVEAYLNPRSHMFP